MGIADVRGVLFNVQAGNGIIYAHFPAKMKIGILLEELG